MISRTGAHALKALVALQNLPAGGYAGAAQIARQIHAPSNYLGKLLRQLALEGIVEGRKGTNGGFRLAAQTSSLSLFDALRPIEHFDRYKMCLLGRPKCVGSDPCLLHEGWSRVRDQYLEYLKATTLSDISTDTPSKSRRKSGRNDRAAQNPRSTAVRSAAGGVR
jgi:Rrf2 family transcriptional regulator, iron-sulfur cluster assembly transcription factor